MDDGFVELIAMPRTSMGYEFDDVVPRKEKMDHLKNKRWRWRLRGRKEEDIERGDLDFEQRKRQNVE